LQWEERCRLKVKVKWKISNVPNYIGSVSTTSVDMSKTARLLRNYIHSEKVLHQKREGRRRRRKLREKCVR
jgi:hypothetical protein